METDMVVLCDDGRITSSIPKRKESPKRSNMGTCSLLRVGVGCLAIAFFAILVVFAIFKSVPNIEKSISKTEKREDIQEIALKAIFSTNYIFGNQSYSMAIQNIDDITHQLNMKLDGNKIRVINGFFRNDSLSKRQRQMVCENPLSGNILQLNIITVYPRQCVSQKENMCKIQFIEQLKNMFSQMLIIPVTIHFDENRFKTVNIKICRLTQITEEKERPFTTKTGRRKAKNPNPPIRMQIQTTEKIWDELVTPYMALKRSQCSMSIGKIAFVQMSGEHGSAIREEIETDDIINDGQNRQYQTVTLYEDTTYRLHVQLDCNGQWARGSDENACDLSQNLKTWIDFNDNRLDDEESSVPYRPSAYNQIQGGKYDLEIYIPIIDGRNTKTGFHLMRLSVIPSEEYRRNCGTIDYNEERQYTVNVLPKATYSVNAAPSNLIFNTAPSDRILNAAPSNRILYAAPPDRIFNAAPSNLIFSNSLCSLNTPKIVLVIMAGERGTQIRDDISTNALINDYRNEHHMAVTLYEHTVYLLRIQLDCASQLNRELFENGCNLAQDVNVWIDINGDGQFDKSEIGAPYRWPVTSYMAHGIYDLQIYIPIINDNYIRTRQHRMRILVMQNENYQRTCGRTDYNETRDYTVNIVPRIRILAPYDVTPPYTVLKNFVCSPHVDKIVLVVMAGEHRTQIRDDASIRAVMRGDNQNQQHLTIILNEDTIYLLRIQLECSEQRTRDSFERNCNLMYDVNVWIDLNDDGRFDDSENAAPFRWPLNSYTPQGIYDLQIYVPLIDERKTKTGPHRMRLVIILNEQYRQQCGNNDYRETREYNVTIVSNTRQTVNTGVPYLTLSNNVCSQTNGKIVLVIMAGEQGTHIRDDIPTNIALTENQNRHHLAVTLYENTVYRIRIQLDCDFLSSRGLFQPNCNLAQDVNVWIDLNNDGQFDESESRIPQRWPLHSYMPLGIYDLKIDVPIIDGQNTRSGSHRMRVVMKPSEEYRRKCGNTDYSETREYTVNIIPRTTYGVPTAMHCSPGNFACSDGNAAIFLVNLLGEQGTQIRDEMKKCSSVNNYNDRSDLAVTLFDNMVYTLHIELYCVQQLRYENSYNQDPSLFETSCQHARYLDIWIDFNNDGIFDEGQERMRPNDRYRDGRDSNQYDLSIVIPKIDGINSLDGQHRMRIILTQDERSRRSCHNTGYGEARDYTIQIIPKSFY